MESTGRTGSPFSTHITQLAMSHEAWKARLVPGFHATEESLISLIELVERVGLNRPQASFDFGQFGSRFSQLSRLLKVCQRLWNWVCPLSQALLKCAVVDQAGLIQRALTGRSKLAIHAQFVLESFEGSLSVSHRVPGPFHGARLASRLKRDHQSRFSRFYFTCHPRLKQLHKRSTLRRAPSGPEGRKRPAFSKE